MSNMKENLPNISVMPGFERYTRNVQQEFEVSAPQTQEMTNLISTIVFVAQVEEIARRRFEWQSHVENMGA